MGELRPCEVPDIAIEDGDLPSTCSNTLCDMNHV